MKMTKARVCVGLCASSEAYDSFLRFLVPRDMAHQSELAHQHEECPSGLAPLRDKSGSATEMFWVVNTTRMRLE